MKNPHDKVIMLYRVHHLAKTIGKHINNAFNEECSDAVIARFATTAADGKVLSSGTLFISVPPSDDGTLQPERAIIITAASCAEHARFI